eukprot:488865-Hanusia_phi.AAC.1
MPGPPSSSSFVIIITRYRTELEDSSDESRLRADPGRCGAGPRSLRHGRIPPGAGRPGAAPGPVLYGNESVGVTESLSRNSVGLECRAGWPGPAAAARPGLDHLFTQPNQARGIEPGPGLRV